MKARRIACGSAVIERQWLLEGGGLRVRLFATADRHAHEVALATGDEWIPILESIEGSPEDEWPASPPCQSLDVTTRDGQTLALLVGMAGKSHWSASIELDPRRGRVTVDVACRIRTPTAGWLGSRYRLLQQPSAQGDDWLEFSVGSVNAPAARLSLAHEPGSRLQPAATELAIMPAPLTQSLAARTVRWQYTFARLGVAE